MLTKNQTGEHRTAMTDVLLLRFRSKRILKKSDTKTITLFKNNITTFTESWNGKTAKRKKQNYKFGQFHCFRPQVWGQTISETRRYPTHNLPPTAFIRRTWQEAGQRQWRSWQTVPLQRSQCVATGAKVRVEAGPMLNCLPQTSTFSVCSSLPKHTTIQYKGSSIYRSTQKRQCLF